MALPPPLYDQILADPDPVRREQALQAYRDLEFERARREGTIFSGGSSGGSSSRRSGSSRTPSLSDLEDIISGMMPPPPPQINLEAAQSSVLQALAPLLESSRAQLEGQFDRGLRALQAQQAASGIYGDPAQTRLAGFMNLRADALRALEAETQAQALAQAMNLINTELNRYRSQQEAEAAARQAAISAFSALSGAQHQANQLAILSMLDAARIRESARQANLPYEMAPQANLLEFFLQLLQQNPYAFQQIMGQVGG